MSKVRSWGGLAVLLPALASAEVLPVGPEFQVNTYTAGDQYVYRTGACGDPTGGFVAVWQSPGQDGSGTGVYAQRFRNATPLGTEFRLNTYTTGAQAAPAVACDAKGDFVAVWQDAGADGSAYGVFARRFGSDGGTLGPEFQVNAYTTGGQSRAHVAAANDGTLVVFQGPDAHVTGVFGRRLGSDGAPVGTEFQLNTYTTNAQTNAFPAVDSTGGFLVVWASPQDGDSSSIVARRWGSDGQPTGSEFVVNAYTTGTQSFPTVTHVGDGFLVLWDGPFGAGSGDDVLGRRLDETGTPVGTDFRVNTYTTGDQEIPSVGHDSRGDLVVTWMSRDQDGDNQGVFGQRYTSAGTPLGTEFQVNTYTTDQQGSYSVLLVDADGDFLVIWHSDTQDGDQLGVFARLFRDPCGDGLVGPGETCDDGSRLPGDCCSPTCQPVAAGTACAADAVDCTADACDGAGACGHVAVDTACSTCRRCDASAGCVVRPRTDCRRPTRARRAFLALTNKSGDRKDRLEYAWTRGDETTLADFGALPASPDYTLCLFDKTSGTDRLVLDATIPAGSSWRKKRRKGFRYRGRGGAPDGVTSAVLQSGRAGKAKASVSGKGAALALPALGLTGPVTATLQAGGNDGVCFGAEFANPAKNTATTFRASGE